MPSKPLKKSEMACNAPKRTPSHPTKSHVVKACYDGTEKLIRFGEQGAKTAGAPKAGESQAMKDKRAPEFPDLPPLKGFRKTTP